MGMGQNCLKTSPILYYRGERARESMVRCWQPSDGDGMENEPKLSEVIKRIAENMLSKPSRLPSSEAAHAALLFAHAGWNRALGHPLDGYERALATFETERPHLWRELKSRS